MRCPNRKCRREVNRLLIKVAPDGKVIEGCHTCVPQQYERHVYTGRKIWAGADVNGVEGNREKIHAFGEKIKQRAEQTRRRYPFRSVPD